MLQETRKEQSSAVLKTSPFEKLKGNNFTSDW